MHPNNKYLHRFANWFGSSAGVIQTAVLVGSVVVLEVINPHIDGHGFWLLYWLTVYSAVTQPILAYVSNDDHLILERIVALEKLILDAVGSNEQSESSE